MQMIEARDFVTGQILDAYPAASLDDVRGAVGRARRAFPSWSETPLRQRLELVRELRTTLVEQLEEVTDASARATGKPPVEILAGDVLMAVDLMSYYEQHAADILAPEERRGHPLHLLSKFHVEYSPRGVIAILSPWNYPLQLSLAPLVTALVAGNTVVLKPSEVTPSVGQLLVELCRDAGVPDGVVNVVQGAGEVGEALVQAQLDLVFFTGSVATGKRVMAAAAQTLTPVLLELGGNDPMIVFDDANLARAARGAVYGAFANAGQSCVAIERLYVQRAAHDELVERISGEMARLRVGSGPGADVGPLIRPQQAEVVDRHIDAALEQGARLVGDRVRDGLLYHPVLLKDVTQQMQIMQEETFGPVLPVMVFDTEDEVVELANGTMFGLNASVWTRDLDRGRRVARRLVTGSCAINDAVKNIANPDMPFGGEKQSGIGRYHGPEGLRALSRQKAVMISGGRLGREINWFPYSRRVQRALRSTIRALYGPGSALSRSRDVVANLLGAGGGDG